MTYITIVLHRCLLYLKLNLSNEIKTKFGTCIRVFDNDNVIEDLSNQFYKFLKFNMFY